MIISKSVNDRLMIMSAHRYCLGRSTYIVGCCVDFLMDHWAQLSNQDKDQIIKETKEAIESNSYGMECDKKEWEILINFAEKGV